MLETCITDKDCDEKGYVCGIDKPGICGHKDVFPTDAIEMIGVFTFAFIMGLCTVAGIGGGGIAISLIIAFFNFTTKPAVAISSLSILVCTTMRFFYNYKTMHPQKKGVVLVDYSLVTIMMPTTIAGSQLGSIILKVFPALLIQVMLTILLAALTMQSFRKALELHRKEKADHAAQQANEYRANSLSSFTLLKSDEDESNERQRRETELIQMPPVSPAPSSRTGLSSDIGSDHGSSTSPTQLVENCAI